VTERTDSPLASPQPETLEVFPALPDEARFWAFGVSRPLSPDEEEALLIRVDAFLSAWKAHGHPLSAARAWVEKRFLWVAVDERIAPPSGCSIDALVRSLRELEGELGVEMVGGGALWIRDGEAGIQRVSRAEFKQGVADGWIVPSTPIFDLTLTRVGEVRGGGWERPAGESWPRRYWMER
jgi:hypothetical protein